jgi:TRAP-type C4-dicarboxylate transport system permease small subunit
MFKVIDKIIHIGDRIYVTICVILLAVLVITVSAGVISRYFFNAPFDWTEELVTLIFIWIAFLGAAVASARHKHVVIDFVTAKASPFVRNIVGVVSDLFIIVFLVMVMIGSVILVPQMMTHESVALSIPKSVYYFAVFASSLLILLIHITSLMREIAFFLHAHRKGEPV